MVAAAKVFRADWAAANQWPDFDVASGAHGDHVLATGAQCPAHAQAGRFDYTGDGVTLADVRAERDFLARYFRLECLLKVVSSPVVEYDTEAGAPLGPLIVQTEDGAFNVWGIKVFPHKSDHRIHLAFGVFDGASWQNQLWVDVGAGGAAPRDETFRVRLQVVQDPANPGAYAHFHLRVRRGAAELATANRSVLGTSRPAGRVLVTYGAVMAESNRLALGMTDLVAEAA